MDPWRLTLGDPVAPETTSTVRVQRRPSTTDVYHTLCDLTEAHVTFPH